MSELTDQPRATIKEAAKPLTGAKRRALQAHGVFADLAGSARRAATVLGWSRRTARLGWNALRSGIRCLERFSARGHRQTEAKQPHLAADSRCLADPESQGDPPVPSPLQSTRLTAHAMRQALVDTQGWTDDELPCEHPIGTRLHRLGCRVRRVQKATPVTRVRESAAMFAHVPQANHASDACGNGTVRERVDTVLGWARPLTWKAIPPIVDLLDKTYAKGVPLAKKAFQKIAQRLTRHAALPKYSVRIQPQGT